MLCPPQLGVWGLPPEKKINFGLKKLCNFEQVLVLLSYITAESGGIIPPVLKVGDLSPLLRRLWAVSVVTLNPMTGFKVTVTGLKVTLFSATL